MPTLFLTSKTFKKCCQRSKMQRTGRWAWGRHVRRPKGCEPRRHDLLGPRDALPHESPSPALLLHFLTRAHVTLFPSHPPCIRIRTRTPPIAKERQKGQLGELGAERPMAAAAVGARALWAWRGPAAACVSRCVPSSSSALLHPHPHAQLSALRGSPALPTPLHLHFSGRRLRVAAAASMSTGPESAGNNPGYCDTPDVVTKSYHVQQTMYRIKDPVASLEFYSKVLGMTLLKRLDFEEAKFSLYFLGYESPESIPTDSAEKSAFLFKCKATLELTHNWGTESDSNFKGYHNGNSDPRGYGHIGITVDDVYKACERFEKLGVEFAKRPDDGRMKGIAFIKDPDGYWIEIFDVGRMSGLINGPPSSSS